MNSNPFYTLFKSVANLKLKNLILTLGAVAGFAAQNASAQTYCSSTASFGGDTDIGQVVFGTFSNPAAAPTLTSNPNATGLYTNFTTLGPSVFPGVTYAFSSTQITSGTTWYTAYMKVYIDYNQNGLFTDVGEQVFSQQGPTTATGPSFTGNITIPTSAPTGCTRMRVVLTESGTSTSVVPCGTYSWGETEDYQICVLSATPCTGVPLAGTASAPDSVCPTVPFSISVSGGSAVSGLAYQWQSATAGATTGFVNIAGATNGSYSAAVGITAGTAYRLRVICTATNDTVYTNIENVYVKNFQQCYCTSGATSNADEEILNVTFNTLNNSSTCATGNSFYTNYTTLGSLTTVFNGVSYSLSLTLGSCGGNYGRSAVVFIDYNQNGSFTDAGESVYSVTYPSSTPNPQTAVAPPILIPPPVIALPGVTRMRVVYVETSPATNVFPCGSYTWGETEDYLITIAQPTPCTGVPNAGVASAPDSVCPNVPFTVTASGGSALSGLTYQWQSAPAGASTGFLPIAGATGPSYTATTGITASRAYRLRVICTATNDTVYTNIENVYLRAIALCYCTPVYANGCTFQDDIDNFSLIGANSTSFNQLGTGCSPGGYANYTNLTPVQMISLTTVGNPYSGSISSNFSSQGARIWIDFNDDGTFSTSEIVANIATFGPTAAAYTLTIPPNSIGGLHRMRVRGVFAPFNPIDPCTSETYGETHDYNVFIIGVPPPPVVINNGPICIGNAITITATSNATTPTFTLTAGPGVVTPVTNTTGVFTITATTNGTYSVTVTSGGYTSIAATTIFTLQPSPVIAQGLLTSPTSCGGTNGSLLLTGLAPNTTYTLNYSRNGTPVTAISVTSNASGVVTMGGLSAASYTQIRLTTAGNCISNQLGPIALNDPNPPVPPTAAYNPPICLGSTLVLTATSLYNNATYTWSGPTGFAPAASTNSTVIRNNMSYADTGLYAVSISVFGCVSAPGTIRVLITPPPAAPTATTSSFCQFSTASPLTAGGQNLKWYTAATGGTALPSAPVPNTTTAGTQTFYVSQTVNTCEGPRTAIIVTIIPRPPVPVTDTVPERCEFAQPTPLSAVGTNLLWYTTATGGVGSPTPSVPATLTTGVYFFYVSQTVNGCESERQSIRVTVKPKPAPPVVVSPIRLCQLDAASPLTAQGQNLLWYNFPSGPGGLSFAPVPFTGYEDTIAYYVSQTVNGCESDRSLINVAVNYKPNASILTDKPFVCQFDTISFTYFGNGRASAQYSWSINGPGEIVSGQGTQGPLVVRYDQPGTYTVSLVVDNVGCLSPVTIRTFEVRQAPRFQVSMKNEACQDEPVTVIASGATAGIDSFQWSFDGGITESGSFNGGPYAVKWSTPGTKVVSVQVQSRECGSQTSRDTIRIDPTPDARIQNFSNGTVCSGDTVQLVADYNPTYTYNWSPSAFFGESRSSTVNAMVSRTGFVRLEVLTGIGCRDVDSTFITTKSCCEAFMPTAFSPNGDTRNDIFRVRSNGFQSFSTLRVTNRWGGTVWETGDQSMGWNGTVNGEPADMGTYFWYMKYTCTDGLIYEKSGEVTLVR